MLAVVKVPHTEIAVNGEGSEQILAWLRQKYKVEVFPSSPAPATRKVDADDELVDINDTKWWAKMRKRLLAGFRLKAGLTQKQLAELSGIRQSVISEYENGRRPLTMAAALKLAPPLSVEPEKLLSE